MYPPLFLRAFCFTVRRVTDGRPSVEPALLRSGPGNSGPRFPVMVMRPVNMHVYPSKPKCPASITATGGPTLMLLTRETRMVYASAALSFSARYLYTFVPCLER